MRIQCKKGSGRMKRGLLIILSGPSGVGKGTIRGYFEKNEDLNLAYSTSMTTRKPREGEVDGVDYFSVQKRNLKTPLKKDNFWNTRNLSEIITEHRWRKWSDYEMKERMFF
jgi:guanylate kinase